MFLISINFAVECNLQLHRETWNEITSAYRQTGRDRVC